MTTPVWESSLHCGMESGRSFQTGTQLEAEAQSIQEVMMDCGGRDDGD